MRREPIAYVGDLPEDVEDREEPQGPTNPRQWALLAALFVATIVVALVPVALSQPTEDETLPAAPTTAAPTAPPTDPPTDPPSVTSSPSPDVCDNQPCISWSPHRLRCVRDRCSPSVRVEGTGRKVLRVTGLKFTGAAAGRLWQEGTCLGATLERGETCSIRVRVRPGEAGRAQLRIQQNLPGPASIVDIEVPASSPSPAAKTDLSLTTEVSCKTVPPSEQFDRYLLTVTTTVLDSAPGTLRQPARVRLTSTRGLRGEGPAPLTGPTTEVPVNVALVSDDYGRQLQLTATVDPDGDVPELDERNNARELVVDLRKPPEREQPVKCVVL